jgi:hypothetical protein
MPRAPRAVLAVRRFASLDRQSRHDVLEAAWWIGVAWVGIRVTRYLTLRRALGRLADSTSAGGDRGDCRDIERVRWAIPAVAAHIPRATCLIRALAADAMLRRRHVASEVRLGVRTAGARRIEAHAWVESNGQAIGAVDPGQAEFKALTR